MTKYGMKSFYKMNQTVQNEGLGGAIAGAFKGAVNGIKQGWSGSPSQPPAQPQSPAAPPPATQQMNFAGATDQAAAQGLYQIHQSLSPLVKIINGLQGPVKQDVMDVYMPFAQGVGQLIRKYQPQQGGQ